MHEGVQETKNIGACDQTRTASHCHVGGVMSWFTHCCTVIIGHWGPEKSFYSKKDYKNEYTNSTCIVGNNLVFIYKDSAITLGVTAMESPESTRERSLRKEHMGDVEVIAQQDQCDSQVPNQSDKVDEGEHIKSKSHSSGSSVIITEWIPSPVYCFPLGSLVNYVNAL